MSKAASKEDVAKAQAKVNAAQGEVNAAQGIADDAAQAENKANTAKSNADKNVSEAQGAANKAQSDKKAQEQAKANADKKVAEAQKAYDDASKKHEADKQVAAQKLADAKTEQAKAQGEYATAKEAQEAGQKAVDSAKAVLDKAKIDSGATGVVNEKAVSKGIGGFFESLMNDPSLTDYQRYQAEKAYNIIVKNSLGVLWYNSEVAGWYDPASKGKKNAMSFQGLKNGLTYIDAMNAIRKANHLNTLGISLEAMAVAILNSQHGGHSEISMTENWAPAGYGPDGSYSGTADVNEWERGYQNGNGHDWPYSGWYTKEKHTYEEALKQHPDLANLSAEGVYYTYPDIYQKTGHYLNFIDPDLKSMGFGVGENGGAVWDGSTSSPTFTQEQFRTLVNTYIDMVEGRGDTSKLVAPQKAYNEAVANQTKLKAAYNEVKQKADEAQKKVDEAQKNLGAFDDVTALDTLQKELDTAQKAAVEAQKNLDAANQKVASTAEELVKAQQAQSEAAAKQALAQANSKDAQAKLAKLQAQLKQAQDELDSLAGLDPALKQNLDDAINALKAAQEAYQKAQQGITDAEATDKKAAEVLEEKLAALKDAEANLQKAEDALTKATKQAKGSKAAYNKLVQIKDEIDKANKGKDEGKPGEPGEGKPGEGKPADVKGNAHDSATQGIPQPSADKTPVKMTKGIQAAQESQGSHGSGKADAQKPGKTNAKASKKSGKKAVKANKELGKTGVSTTLAAIVSSVMALLGIGGVTVASKRREND